MKSKSKDGLKHYYRCMQTQFISQDGLTLMPIQSDHIELIWQWRNALIDVLRQSEPITE